MPLTREHYEQIRAQRAAIRRHIIRHLEQRPRGIVDMTSWQLNVSAGIVYEELRRLVFQGHVRAEGNTSARRNYLTEKGRALRKLQRQQGRSGRTMSQQEAVNRHVNMKSGKAENPETGVLTRKPRNYFEAERLAWLKRRQGVR